MTDLPHVPIVDYYWPVLAVATRRTVPTAPSLQRRVTDKSDNGC